MPPQYPMKNQIDGIMSITGLPSDRINQNDDLAKSKFDENRKYFSFREISCQYSLTVEKLRLWLSHCEIPGHVLRSPRNGAVLNRNSFPAPSIIYLGMD